MRFGLAICVFLSALSWGSGQETGRQEREIGQAQQEPTPLQYECTAEPCLSAEKELEWVTFLVEHLYDQRPGYSLDLEGKAASTWIALLLEISLHSEKVVVATVRAFLDQVEWRTFQFDDTCRLIEQVKINVPHYPTPGWGPRMRPMSIVDDKIVFKTGWSPNRSGRWINPFYIFEGPPEWTIYDFEKDRYGERDLDLYKSQMLSPAQRAKLWQTFLDK